MKLEGVRVEAVEELVRSLLAFRPDLAALLDAARLLHGFAHTGRAEDDGAIDAALAHLILALYVPLLRTEGDPMRVTITVGRNAAVAVVVLAARGRRRLALERCITIPELAALSGYDASTLRWRARRSHLHRAKRSPRAPIDRRSAEAFLASVGIPPYG